MAGSSTKRSPGTNGTRTTASACGSSRRNRAFAVGGSGQPSLTIARTATWPPARVTAATAVVAARADQAVTRQATMRGRPLAIAAGYLGGCRIAPMSQAGWSQAARVVDPAPPWAPQITSSARTWAAERSQAGSLSSPGGGGCGSSKRIWVSVLGVAAGGQAG